VSSKPVAIAAGVRPAALRLAGRVARRPLGARGNTEKENCVEKPNQKDCVVCCRRFWPAYMPASRRTLQSCCARHVAATADPTPRPHPGRTRRPHALPAQLGARYTDFSFAPPHNEPDWPLLAVLTVIKSAGGASSTCNAYARYLLRIPGAQTLWKNIARHAFVFSAHIFLLATRATIKYTAQVAGIAFEPPSAWVSSCQEFEFRRDPAPGGLAGQVQPLTLG